VREVLIVVLHVIQEIICLHPVVDACVATTVGILLFNKVLDYLERVPVAVL
jgi:hypothetical protein